MAAVVDLWHTEKPKTPRGRCAEHKKFPTPLHGKGRRWQVRWRAANGRQRKETWAKRADADRRAAQVSAELARGLLGDTATGRETVREVAERWAATAHHRPGTAERTERVLRLHILPLLGDTPIRAVTRRDIQAWVADRAEVLAPSSMQSTYAVLASIFSEAVRDGLISRSPCSRIRLPADVRREIRPPTATQVAALVDAAPAHYRAALLLAASAGLRWGEVFGLEADALDLRAGTVTIRRQLVGPAAGLPYLDRPKTAKSLRTVPLPQVAVEALRAHLRAFPPQGVVLDDRTDPRRPERRTAMLVFPSAEGEALRRSNWSRRWEKIVGRANRALREAGQEPVAERTTFHTLRHGYISTLVQAGVSIKAVQTYAGHSNPGVTMKVYAHVLPGADDTARTVIEAALGAAPILRPAAPDPTVSAGQEGGGSDRTSSGHRRRTAPRTPACPAPRRRSAAAGREA
nr:tyrosine-type recombinase/integrase [Streptomyces barkulensis]